MKNIKGIIGFIFDLFLSSLLFFLRVLILWRVELDIYPVIGVAPKNYILIFFILNCLITYLIYAKKYRFRSWYEQRIIQIKKSTYTVIIITIGILGVLPILFAT